MRKAKVHGLVGLRCDLFDFNEIGRFVRSVDVLTVGSSGSFMVQRYPDLRVRTGPSF